MTQITVDPNPMVGGDGEPPKKGEDHTLRGQGRPPLVPVSMQGYLISWKLYCRRVWSPN